MYPNCFLPPRLFPMSGKYGQKLSNGWKHSFLALENKYCRNSAGYRVGPARSSQAHGRSALSPGSTQQPQTGWKPVPLSKVWKPAISQLSFCDFCAFSRPTFSNGWKKCFQGLETPGEVTRPTIRVDLREFVIKYRGRTNPVDPACRADEKRGLSLRKQ